MSLEPVKTSDFKLLTPNDLSPTPVETLAPAQMEGFPFRYRRLSLDRCGVTPGNELAIRAAREWVSGERENLWFYGAPGTGKTHIASAAMSERLGYLCRFWSVPVMLLEFQAAVKEHDELKTIYKYMGAGRTPYDRACLLLFDDVAAHRVSDFGLEMLGILLDKLYGACTTGIICTSNLSPKQVLETMGERIASRMRGLAHPVELTGQDRRFG